MSAVIEMRHFRSPARVIEAQQIEAIRRDCTEAGLNAHQTQRVLARARKSLRELERIEAALRADTRPDKVFQAVFERGKARNVSSFTLLDGLQAALQALAAGCSGGWAVYSANKAMRPKAPARGVDGGAA